MVNWIRSIPERTTDDLVLVVDGGGTRSRAAVAALDGTLVGRAEGGPTNARSVGPDVAAANVADLVARAAGDDAATVGYALVSSASVDTVEQAEHLAAATRTVLVNATVAGLPDTIGCWAASNALGPAVGVIAGTGSVVVVADLDRGLWQRYGGWDFILGDEGSGYALGRAALREAMLVGEGRSSATALCDAVMSSPGALDKHVTTTEGLPDAAHSPIDKAWIASFARVLLDLADGGDEHCVAIVAHEIAPLAAAAAAGADLLRSTEGAGGEPIPVGLFGGTFSSPTVCGLFRAAVEARSAGRVSVSVPAHSALVGTFALAVGMGATAGVRVDRSQVAAAADRLSADLAARG